MNFEKESQINEITIEEKVLSFDEKGFVKFSKVARELLEMQTQYASRYTDNLDGDYPNFAEDLRIEGGDSGDYYEMKIHKDDIETFVKRVRQYKNR